MAFDSSGNLYASSYDTPSSSTSVGHVYKITSGGVVTSFASGLNTPFSVSIDKSNNLYVSSNFLTGSATSVYKITPGGSVSAFVSGITGAFASLDSSENVVIASFGTNTINIFCAASAVLTSKWTRPATPFTVMSAVVATIGLLNGDGGSTGSVGILAWGAQAEPLPGATSLMPTTTAPATRSADSIGAITWSGITSGTIYAEGDTLLPDTLQRLLELNDGTTNNLAALSFNASAQDEFDVNSGGTTQTSLAANYASSYTFVDGLLVSNNGLLSPSHQIPQDLEFSGVVEFTGTLEAAVGLISEGVIFADLPPATPGTIIYITDGKASNCADGLCTTWGTAITGGGGALNLFAWYNGANWTLLGK